MRKLGPGESCWNNSMLGLNKAPGGEKEAVAKSPLEGGSVGDSCEPRKSRGSLQAKVRSGIHSCFPLH